MRTTSLILLASVLGLSACDSQSDGKQDAKVADAKPAAGDKDQDKDKVAPTAAEKTAKVDAAASKIGFVGAKVTADHEGSFGKFDGSMTLEGKTPKSVEFTVDMGSLAIEPEDLQKHLAGPDFFEVEKFTEAKFASTSITEKAGEGGTTHEVEGNLTLKGVTKSVTFGATLDVDDAKATGKTEFNIDRKDFGIVYAGMADDLIKDKVLLKIDLSFPIT